MNKLKEKIGFIGFGNMGFAILKGLMNAHVVDLSQIFIFDPDPKKLQMFEKNTVHVCKNNAEVVSASDILILAVKPQEIVNIAKDIRPKFKKDQIVISILAGTPLAKLKKLLGEKATFVRAMPNLAATVGQAMTAIASDSNDALETAETIFKTCGTVALLKEENFDLVTAISGSGPAYFFLLMEILSTFAQKNGIPKNKADQLAIQTALGASTLANSEGDSIEKNVDLLKMLRGRVSSKGGTTEAALKILFEKLTPEIFEEALKAAVKRSAELSKE